MSKVNFFGTFTKVDELDDGTLHVEGIASSESRDSQGEIVRADAVRKALPDYLKFPTLREMHKAWAAGRTVAADVLPDGTTHIAAHVVDEAAIKKVKAKVYNGFSIGGRATARDKTDPSIVDAVELTEISLVDRPANPDCVLQLVKLQEGTAMTDIAKTDQSPEQPIAAPTEQITTDTPAPAADSVTKSDDGSEIFDARAALEAAMLVSNLIYREQNEDENEATQVAYLKSALDALRAFVAAEILEGDEGEGEAPTDEATKGDFPGHPFRGNQHAGGNSGGGKSKASKGAHKASKEAEKAGTKEAHKEAADKHRAAAEKHSKAGNTGVAVYHQSMADYHAGAAKGSKKAKKADTLNDIEKAAKVSASVRKMCKAHHDALMKVAEEFSKLGWNDQEPEDNPQPDEEQETQKPASEKADTATDLAKVASLESTVKEQADALTKAQEAIEQLLTDRKAIEAQLKVKGVLRVVEKAADVGNVAKAEDEPTDTVGLIRKSLRNPMVPF